MLETKTFNDLKIPNSVRGIVYLCKVDQENLKIRVVSELAYKNPFDALEVYANIPNPASQIVTGETYADLCAKLKLRHTQMKDPKWVKELLNYL